MARGGCGFCVLDSRATPALLAHIPFPGFIHDSDACEMFAANVALLLSVPPLLFSQILSLFSLAGTKAKNGASYLPGLMLTCGSFFGQRQMTLECNSWM